jgi:hypothetical protein
MFLALGYTNIPNGMMVCWYIGILRGNVEENGSPCAKLS